MVGQRIKQEEKEFVRLIGVKNNCKKKSFACVATQMGLTVTLHLSATGNYIKYHYSCAPEQPFCCHMTGKNQKGHTHSTKDRSSLFEPEQPLGWEKCEQKDLFRLKHPPKCWHRLLFDNEDFVPFVSSYQVRGKKKAYTVKS